MAASLATSAGWRKSLSSTIVASRRRDGDARGGDQRRQWGELAAEMVLGDQRVEPERFGLAGDVLPLLARGA